MSMERTPSARTGRRSDNLFIFFLHLISTQSTCQRVSTLSLNVGQYCPTNPPDNRGRHLMQMPQQGSFFSYFSPGSSLGKSMTSKLVCNFPLMFMYFTSSLLRVPNKAITDVTNLLTSVSEHAVNLNVERETCLHLLFVCNNGSNSTTLRKCFFFFFFARL